jgi:hypothetical protein
MDKRRGSGDVRLALPFLEPKISETRAAADGFVKNELSAPLRLEKRRKLMGSPGFKPRTKGIQDASQFAHCLRLSRHPRPKVWVPGARGVRIGSAPHSPSLCTVRLPPRRSTALAQDCG